MPYADKDILGVTMTEYGVCFSVGGYPVLTAEMSADELIDLIRAATKGGPDMTITVQTFDADLLRATGFEARPGKANPNATAYDLPGTGWSIYDATVDTGGRFPWGYEHDGRECGHVATFAGALDAINAEREDDA
jgi:hypothetical protein